ncbi:MAG: PhzF family phenazine biosynthesis protein [Pseudomonadota bacterium]
MRYHFVTTDVFTDRLFGGNPLAVLPDARGLGDAAMQQIAREFNLSETVFVLPPDNPANSRKLRIFTPACEVPFAGHPTLGTALVLARLGEISLAGEVTEIVLEEGAGPVPVMLRAADGVVNFAQLTAPQAPSIGPGPAPAVVASALSLTPSDVITTDGLPKVVSCGLPFLLVRLASRDALGRAKLNRTVWARQLAGTPGEFVYLFTEDVPADASHDIQARMFCPGAGFEEDPATGSAAAALGGWLGHVAPESDATTRAVIGQALEIGRPSRLEVEVERRSGQVTAVRVGGTAVLVSEGTIEVPETPDAATSQATVTQSMAADLEGVEA